jgi:transposase InsO family protein
MSFLATTDGITGGDVRDLMLAAVEHRFGLVNRLPVTIEWLSDNGSCYIAGETRGFAREIGLEPRTTPIESPQSNGMAEAFVRTIKRDTSASVLVPMTACRAARCPWPAEQCAHHRDAAGLRPRTAARHSPRQTLSSLSCRRAVTSSASRSTAAQRCAERVGRVATNSAIMRASSQSFLARTPHALANWRSLNQEKSDGSSVN